MYKCTCLVIYDFIIVAYAILIYYRIVGLFREIKKKRTRPFGRKIMAEEGTRIFRNASETICGRLLWIKSRILDIKEKCMGLCHSRRSKFHHHRCCCFCCCCCYHGCYEFILFTKTNHISASNTYLVTSHPPPLTNARTPAPTHSY
jgi:hypothetical protein